MSDTPSIFNNQSSETPNPQGGSNTPNVQIDPSIATILGEIKNERGEPKYKTLNDAITALKHSQEYIPTLNSKLQEQNAELERLRGEAGRVSEIEATVRALTQKQAEASTNANPALSEETIANLVTRTLSQREQAAKAQENQQSVVASMQAKFGTEAEKVFYQKAQELGMTVEEFNALAAKTPKAVLNLIGVDVRPATTGAPASSTVNASGFQPKQNTNIGRNNHSTLIGATSEELAQESQRAKDMIVELEAQGLSINDLTNPKFYFKHFK